MREGHLPDYRRRPRRARPTWCRICYRTSEPLACRLISRGAIAHVVYRCPNDHLFELFIDTLGDLPTICSQLQLIPWWAEVVHDARCSMPDCRVWRSKELVRYLAVKEL